MEQRYHLHPKQIVIVNHHVSFKHYVSLRRYFEIELSHHQFLNLNDIITCLHVLKELKRYPLGDGMWLCDYNPFIVIQCDNSDTYFQFYRRSWDKYIRKVHHKIYSFLRHGISTNDGYQHDAADTSQYLAVSRRNSQAIRRQQTLSRSPRNVVDENEQRQKYSAISRGKSSSPRSDERLRSAINVARMSEEAENVQEDGELSDVESNISQYGSACSIE